MEWFNLNVGILWADSQFTPWKENIDLGTVERVGASFLELGCSVTILHMEGLNTEFAERLKAFDVIYNMCYGYHEHSQSDVAFWLDLHRVKHLTSSGKSQQLAANKLNVEHLCMDINIPVPISLVSPEEVIFSYYYIAKPNQGGCHRGIEIVPGEIVLENWNYWRKNGYIIQPYLSGREFTIGVLPSEQGTHFEVTNPIEIVPFPERDIYIAGQSFGATQRLLKPEIEPSIARTLSYIAIKAHRMLHLEYFGRCDFRYHNGTCYLLDINTMPNMHPKLSMFPAMLQESGLSLTEFLARVIQRYRLLEFGKTAVEKYATLSIQRN